jgi:hypothetical protein
MVLHVVILFLSVHLMRGLDESLWKLLAALLPLIPIGLGLIDFLLLFVKMEKLQKRIQQDALAFNFAATGPLTFSNGLLQNVGQPRVSLVAVFPLALWGLGYVISARSYQ